MVQLMVMPTPKDKKSRRSRIERDPKARVRPLAMIERGIETLRLLDLVRFATNDHVQTTFEAKTKTGRPRAPKGAEFACNRALRELYDGGWIERVWVLLPRGDYKHYKEGYVNVLTTKGLREVQLSYDLDGKGQHTHYETKNQPDDLRPLIHPFAIADFYFTARAACRPHPWLFGSWMDDKELASRKAGGFGFTNIPDGFFVITNEETDRDWPHFLELDLGTESVIAYTKRDDWVKKIQGYVDYIGAGKTRGPYADDFLDLPDPVVLIVTVANTRGNPDARRDLILEAVKLGGGAGRFWVTTFDELLKHGLWGKIWHTTVSTTPRSLLDRCNQ